MRPSVLVGLRRTCRRCNVEKFASLFKKGRRLCKVCVGELQLAYHHAKKEERKKIGLTHAGAPRSRARRCPMCFCRLHGFPRKEDGARTTAAVSLRRVMCASIHRAT